MHLVQLLLPLYADTGETLPDAAFSSVRDELTSRFGGLTAYSRAPAQGLWKGPSERTTQDDIVLVEIMVEDLDRSWWHTYRGELERRFRQKEIVIRAQEIERL